MAKPDTTHDSARLQLPSTELPRLVSSALPPDAVDLLLDQLKRQWKRYRKGLKACQKAFSEPGVHNSRVEARRLLSMLELLSPLLHQGQLEEGRRALKRHIDAFDDLRDTHVQLLTLEPLRKRFEAVSKFESYLQKREKRCTRKTRKAVKRVRTRRLEKLIGTWRKELKKLCDGIPAAKISSRILSGLHKAFAVTSRLKAKIDAADTRSIHCTRVAFKKFRYMVEILVSLRPGSHKRLLCAMHDYQTLMGKIQDAEVLLLAYEKFLRKGKHRSDDTARFLAELLRRRDSLIHHYMSHANELFRFNPFPETMRATQRVRRENVSASAAQPLSQQAGSALASSPPAII